MKLKFDFGTLFGGYAYHRARGTGFSMFEWDGKHIWIYIQEIWMKKL